MIFLKNPYVLEFLNLPEYPIYSELGLETAIIDRLEHFLLELGKGFLFEARQKRLTKNKKKTLISNLLQVKLRKTNKMKNFLEKKKGIMHLNTLHLFL
ncbi:MAG: PDDEXK nuclease domain-containing protein [Desulforegulaceae bacterium]|nr:PDDEXK nuclease domain-containing protein [Desulforegulaceae bacterium]